MSDLRLCLVALSVLGCLFVSCNSPVPVPSGPYPVGTTILELKPDNSSEFMVRVWYPARQVDGYPTVPNINPRQAEALERFMGFPRFLAASGKASQSHVDAPAITGRNWPVVIFEHGAASFETQNFFLLQELASNGYAVMAVNHPGFSLVSEFPDAREIWADSQAFKKRLADQQKRLPAITDRVAEIIQSVRQAKTVQAAWEGLRTLANTEPYDLYSKELESRLVDLVFLKSQLPVLDQQGPLADTMDITKVALLGHSLGGITVVEALSRFPELFDLAINYDGPQLAFADSQPSLAKPVLFMYSTNLAFGSRRLNMSGLNGVWAETARAPVYQITIAGTGHYNFSDLTYLPVLRDSGMIGPIDGSRAGMMYTELTKSFLDCFMKAGQKQWSAGLAADWPEISIRFH